MSEDERDGVVADVADALTLNQDVDWDRCAREATPSVRRSLDNLRLVARMLADAPVRDETAPGAPAAGSRLPGGVVVRRFLGAIIALAAVEVAAALLLLPWMWNDYHRQHGDPAVFLTALLLGHTATASLLLLVGRRRDQRTWLLGAYFLLKAPIAGLYMVCVALWEIPPHTIQGFVQDSPTPARVLAYLSVLPSLAAPALLWAFARECPRIRRRTRLDDLTRRMVPVSVGIGCAMWVGVMAAEELAGYGAEMASTALVAANLSALAAVAVVGRRARSARADEARRVLVFSGGFLLYVGSAVAYDVTQLFPPGYWLAAFQWTPEALLIGLLRFPGTLLLWYAVLAVRVPDLREVVRVFYKRLLMPRGLLGVASAAPAVMLGWLVASRPERTVGAVAADPLARWLFVATAFLLLAAAARERLLVRLNAWLHPEIADQRRALADAAAALAKLGRITAINRTVRRTAKRSCGTPVTLLVRTDATPEAQDLADADGEMSPLARASAIVHMLETGGGSLRVHPEDTASDFNVLPHDDARWVVESGADVIVPVPGAGVELLGVLVAGRRLDGRLVRSVDLPFLEALAAATGLAVGRVLLMGAGAAGSLDPPPAKECPVCGCVAQADEPPECDCGSVYVETEAPKLLAGKYRLTRRLGSGGMGVAYLARDLRLERDVAVKTLTGVSVFRLLGSKPEAWAMATVTHPAVAQIYGIESWRDRPFLVVEFLPRGTLADRLRRGPVAAPRALDIAARLADALEALHEAGYLHGDIKPSNVGFASDGSPKLLDFGLARQTNDTTGLGGTARYMSPEVLSGRPAGEADDVWSLCVMLYEMVAGEHPFAEGSADEVRDRIRRQRLDRSAPSAASSSPPSTAVMFATSMLTARRSDRPATARALADRLRVLRVAARGESPG